MMKKNICVAVLICLLSLFTACGQRYKEQHVVYITKTEYVEEALDVSKVQENESIPEENECEKGTFPDEETEGSTYQEGAVFINLEGETIESRILTPAGYVRAEAEEGSFLQYLRNFPVKEDGSPVLLYDGSEKWNQSAHVAVLGLPIENVDLQQCADSVMRIYAEYFWASGQKDRIKFHFTNGFEAPYTKWRDGYRVKVDGNQVSWVHSAEMDESYEAFVKYMKIIFSYAGTLSMDKQANPITIEEMHAGDVFLKGGSPGQVVMVIDICENEIGEKAFLLAQGYMPAQEFHVLKNPESETDPWYYASDIAYPFITPEYVFDEGSLQRPEY